MKKVLVVIAGVVVWMGFSPERSLATEPCPPNPCISSTGQFEEAACREAAEWIAVGSISDVQHDRQNYPLNKDFATFGFTPESWEKGPPQSTKSFHFKVGWCDNPTEVPADYSGKFRFYGMATTSTTGSSQYLYFILAQ